MNTTHLSSNQNKTSVMLKPTLPELMMLLLTSSSPEDNKLNTEFNQSLKIWISIEKLFKKKPLLDNKTPKLMKPLLLNTTKVSPLLMKPFHSLPPSPMDHSFKSKNSKPSSTESPRKHGEELRMDPCSKLWFHQPHNKTSLIKVSSNKSLTL